MFGSNGDESTKSFVFCFQVKERLKKQKQDKAALKAADVKKGGKPTKNLQGTRAPAKGARR